MLSDMTNRGFSAATNAGNFGMSGANTLAGLMTGQGNAQAAGTMGAANAWQGALGSAGNAIGGQMMLNQYLGGNGLPKNMVT
jgi:hypothetical protein